ncbi:MAG: hypothetical protein Q8O76_03625 [Chloroflexota bacterium]|nr:hypothetical protein [Chloroflexota bacterium]
MRAKEITLEAALAREDWDGAARCLLAGVARALRGVPPDSLEGLLEILSRRNDVPGKARQQRPPKESH